MATVKQCRAALESLNSRFLRLDAELRQACLGDRTLSCHVPDLGVTFLARLGPRGADPIIEVHDGQPTAQIRVTASSDEVLAVAEDPGSFAVAWHSGRLKVEGSFGDMLLLRSLI